jgi:hypothetical protein
MQDEPATIPFPGPATEPVRRPAAGGDQGSF